MTEKEDISISEAAQILGLSVEQIRRYCLQGTLDAVQYVPGGAYHIKRESVERLQAGWADVEEDSTR
jgi:excisionase family DNA binding protein